MLHRSILWVLVLQLLGSTMLPQIFFMGTGTPEEYVVPVDFQTIQEAINAAGFGDTVLVKSGIYYEHVVVNQSLSLIGENRGETIIHGKGCGSPLTVTSSNVSVSNFTIKAGSRVHFRGINVFNSSGNVLCNNIVAENFVGIQLNYSTDNVIRSNKITGNRYGVFLSHSNQNLVVNNTILNSDWDGVELDWSHNNVIRGNYVANSSMHGFEVPLYAPSLGNLVYHNNFVNNSRQALEDPWRGDDSWDNGGEGNYWSDYKGDDRDRNGIGDRPYHVEGHAGCKDQYPLMGMFQTFTVSGGGTTHTVPVITNSTIHGLSFEPEEAMLKLNISGGQSSSGFIRIKIPGSVLWCDHSDTWVVWLGNQTVEPNILKNVTDQNFTVIYLSYSHPPPNIRIEGTHAIPEFPSEILLSLCLFAGSALAGVTLKVKHPRETENDVAD